MIVLFFVMRTPPMELRFFSQMEVDIIACVSLFRRRGFVQQLVFVVPRSTVFVDLFYEWSVSCRGEVVRVGSARPVHARPSHFDFLRHLPFGNRSVQNAGDIVDSTNSY